MKGVFAGTATRKPTNTPAVIFSYSCWDRWFIFTYYIILSHFLQLLTKVLKIGVLSKTFHDSQETPVSEFHFNQPVTCYFFNKRLRHGCFLVNFAKLSRIAIFTDHFGIPASVFIEHINNITKFTVNLRKWLFPPFETLINIEMYTCEIKIT